MNTHGASGHKRCGTCKHWKSLQSFSDGTCNHPKTIIENQKGENFMIDNTGYHSMCIVGFDYVCWGARRYEEKLKP